MRNLAIRVEGLGKEYRIGGLRQITHRNFREFMTDALSGPLRRARNLLSGQAYGAAEMTETIWALKDISFEVHEGEVVGIIGPNGAGKSTLLKVLSRITEPSTGYVDLWGRVGALLEVGTGFHVELTGRENIYLNGAILGMKRTEIDRKFDEIVDFSGVEKFIDTPVKFYSSGMRLRLGFAVAAHLEPDILIVDEVLAVGDAEFQRKSLGKMESVANEGRTVLFVSHNMAAISSLTERCIWLENGRIKLDTDTAQAVAEYVKHSSKSVNNGGVTLAHLPRGRFKDWSQSKCIYARLLNSQNEQTNSIEEGTPFTFEITFEAQQVLEGTLQFGCVITAVDKAVELFTIPSPEISADLAKGTYQVAMRVDHNLLRPGNYAISIKMFLNGKRQDHLKDILSFTIVGGSLARQNLAYLQPWVSGYFNFEAEWTGIQSSNEPENILGR